MAAVALIKFTQGVNIGLDGQVLVGTTGTLVSLANVNNTGVASWQIDLVYVPSGSAVPIAIPLAFSNNSSVPAGSFTPDVTGSYRLVLTVWDLINRTGTHDVDIRNFVVPEVKHGGVIPPYQQDPPPKPSLASGLPGAKPNEMNIGGVELGWTGDGTDGLLAEQLKTLDGGIYDSDIGSSVPGEAVQVVGASADAPIWHPQNILTDGTHIIIPPGFVGNTWVKINQTDYSDYEWAASYPLSTGSNSYLAPTGTLFLQWSDFATIGTDIWAVGQIKLVGTGFLFKITWTGDLKVPDPSTVPVVLPGEIPYSLEYDPTANKLWLCTDLGNLVKVDPITTTPTVYSIGGASFNSLRIDQNAANHAGIKRGFLLDYVNNNILRFRVDTGFTAEPSFAAAQPPTALAVGENFGGLVFVVEGGTVIRRYDKDLVGVNATGLYGALFDEISWLDIDPNTGRLWVMGLSRALVNGQLLWNNCLVARVNGSTMAVESIIELSTDSNGGRSVGNGGPGLGPHPVTPRFKFFDGKVWIFDPQFAFFTSFPSGFGETDGFICNVTGGGTGALTTANDGAVNAETGVGASIDTSYFGDVTISGLSGMVAAFIGQNIVLTGATNPDNNGAFPITSIISATSVKYFNPKAVQSDTATWTVGDPRFTSAGSTFVTDGVLPGDKLAVQGFVFTVKTVNSQTQLTVDDPFSFGGPAVAMTFSVYRPMTKQVVPLAGTKTLGLVDQSWRDFQPVFEAGDGLAQLGDGVLTGRYRIVGDSAEIQLNFVRGTTTTFGSDQFAVPLPPGVSFPHNRGHYPFANTDVIQTHVIGVGSTSPVGVVFPIEILSPTFAFFLSPLSGSVPSPGDFVILKYTIRMRKP